MSHEIDDSWHELSKRAFAAWLGEKFHRSGAPNDVHRYGQCLIKSGRAPATINRVLMARTGLRIGEVCTQAR